MVYFTIHFVRIHAYGICLMARNDVFYARRRIATETTFLLER